MCFAVVRVIGIAAAKLDRVALIAAFRHIVCSGADITLRVIVLPAGIKIQENLTWPLFPDAIDAQTVVLVFETAVRPREGVITIAEEFAQTPVMADGMIETE